MTDHTDLRDRIAETLDDLDPCPHERHGGPCNRCAADAVMAAVVTPLLDEVERLTTMTKAQRKLNKQYVANAQAAEDGWWRQNRELRARIDAALALCTVKATATLDDLWRQLGDIRRALTADPPGVTSREPAGRRHMRLPGVMRHTVDGHPLCVHGLHLIEACSKCVADEAKRERQRCAERLRAEAQRLFDRDSSQDTYVAFARGLIHAADLLMEASDD